MNKNLKKIIRFYLYSMIVLSATEALCSERNSSKTENLQKVIPVFSFISMKEDYDDIVFNLPEGEKTYVNIQCDMCDETADGLISNAYRNILNHKKSLPVFSFISMTTKKDYDDIVFNLPRGEKTHVNIQCDICDKTADGLIPDAYKIIFAHKKLHQSKKNSEIPNRNLLPNNNISDVIDNNEKQSLPPNNNALSLILNQEKSPSLDKNNIFNNIFWINQNFNNQPNTEQVEYNTETKKRKITDLLSPETNPSIPKPDKIQKIENKTSDSDSSIKYDGGYAILEFSLIDTPQKYNDIARRLGGKSILTTIKCSQHLCNTTASGLFSVAQFNMRTHTKKVHGIICPTGGGLRKKFGPDRKNETNYIQLTFSSIATQEQYDNWALEHDDRKATKVIIKCILCPSKRKGELATARSHILDHMEDKHLICRCGKKYESIMQIEDCKKYH